MTKAIVNVNSLLNHVPSIQIHHRAPIAIRKSDWNRAAYRSMDHRGKTERSGHSNEKRSRGHTKPVRRVTRSRNGGLNTPETRVRVFAIIVYLDSYKSTDPAGLTAQPAASQFARQYEFYVWLHPDRQVLHLSKRNLATVRCCIGA